MGEETSSAPQDTAETYSPARTPPTSQGSYKSLSEPCPSWPSSPAAFKGQDRMQERHAARPRRMSNLLLKGRTPGPLGARSMRQALEGAPCPKVKSFPRPVKTPVWQRPHETSVTCSAASTPRISAGASCGCKLPSPNCARHTSHVNYPHHHLLAGTDASRGHRRAPIPGKSNTGAANFARPRIRTRSCEDDMQHDLLPAHGLRFPTQTRDRHPSHMRYDQSRTTLPGHAQLAGARHPRGPQLLLAPPPRLHFACRVVHYPHFPK